VSKFYLTAMDLLAQRNAGADWDDLVAQTGWQPDSVRNIVSRARRGLLSPPGRRKGAWSRQADDLLRHYWTSCNAAQIAALLHEERPGATASAVNGRARRLGLRKPVLHRNRYEWRFSGIEARP
jgi:hypothetical protein